MGEQLACQAAAHGSLSGGYFQLCLNFGLIWDMISLHIIVKSGKKSENW
jgi:hypothetical protein